MKKLLFALFCLAGFACTHPGSQPNRTSGPVYHTVSRSGETLASISDWYTGSPNNWRIILKENSSIDPSRLRMGDQIYIPATLVFRRDPFPASMISTSRKAASTQAVKRDAELTAKPSADTEVPKDSGTVTASNEDKPQAGAAAAVDESQTVAIKESEAAAAEAALNAKQVEGASQEQAAQGTSHIEAATAHIEAATAHMEAEVAKANDSSNKAADLAQAGDHDAAMAQAQKAQEEAQQAGDAALKAGKEAADKALADSKAALQDAQGQVKDPQALAAMKDAEKAVDDSSKAVADIPDQAGGY